MQPIACRLAIQRCSSGASEMWWPIWIALTCLGGAVTWFTDRTAFVAYAFILVGLIAMQYPWTFPAISALTIWSVIALIVISTNQSILAGSLAFCVSLCYIPALVGWPIMSAYFWSDVAGLALLAALILPTILGLVGRADLADTRWIGSSPLPTWPASAVQALARTQKEASPEALRDL